MAAHGGVHTVGFTYVSFLTTKVIPLLQTTECDLVLQFCMKGIMYLSKQESKEGF